MNLKRDTKGHLAEVTPLRSRKGSIYTKGSNETFKISRSKFTNFLEDEVLIGSLSAGVRSLVPVKSI